MQRYKAIISYDGSEFSGYQVQPNKRTVQREVEAVLAKMHKGSPIKVIGSGRTDSGVHAMGQVLHFDSPLMIPDDKWVIALNTMLPEDITVLQVQKVSASFHARFDAVGKEYRYVLYLSSLRDPFQRNFACHHPYKLNIEAMQEASTYFLGGPHDFTSFCSAKTDVVDKIRTIETIDITLKGEILTIRFIGSGFLYNMVRILVGTLLEVGSGDRDPESIPAILEKKDRSCAGRTVPGQGLYLWRVFY
jgi:tRNA pseudouridine38-40 synthase